MQKEFIEKAIDCLPSSEAILSGMDFCCAGSSITSGAQSVYRWKERQDKDTHKKRESGKEMFEKDFEA